jgi:HAD superfamily hydrolase (TIGR01549 family)
MKKLSGIAVCIWDFDGTFYQQQPALWDNIRWTEIKVIMEHTGWTKEKATDEFYKIYKVKTPSGTKTVSLLTGISNAQASVETSRYTDYDSFLHADPKLAGMLASLDRYRHFMLVNGSQESVNRGLTILGVDKGFFEEIVTSELVGETKPSLKGFTYIVGKTGLPASSHLMIGDREAVDLAPAKSMGIHTCLVWSDTPGDVAEVTVPTVYDVAGVLG